MAGQVVKGTGEERYVVPRARLSDGVRAGVCALAGAVSLWAGLTNVWMLPLAVVLCGFTVLACIKMMDRRPVVIATRHGIEVCRFLAPSGTIRWDWLDEVFYMRERRKRVLGFKVTRAEADGSATVTIKVPSTEFRGDGADVAARLNELRDEHA